MLIKWGAMVVDGSGKLGGHIASKNRGGQYFKTKVTPVNPQTPFQTTNRAYFAQLSQGWSSLTAAQIRGWNEAVELFRYTNVFGDLKSLSGKSLYQQLNQNLLLTGQATIDDAPEPVAVPAPTALEATGAVAVPAFDIATTGASTGSQLFVRATPILSNGTTFIKNRLRAVQTAAGGNDVSLDILADYTTRFEAPTEGANIWVAVKAVNANGQASPEITAQAIISA